MSRNNKEYYLDTNLVFEGDRYIKLRSKFLSYNRFYNKVDLNKVLLADISPDLNIKNNISLIKKFSFAFEVINLIFKSLIRVVFFKEVIFMNRKDNFNIWVLKNPSIRSSYLQEIKNNNSNKVKFSSVTWKKIFLKFNLYLGFKRITTFLSYFFFYDLNYFDIKKRINLVNIIIKATDLCDDFNKHNLPKAIFSIKDFQRYENAIIQIANICKVQTFSTPHSVAHYFVDKNERNGNLILYNSTAKNILAWGNFNNSIFKKYNSKSKIIPSQAYLRPSINENRSNLHTTNQLVISLGSKNHDIENLALLKLIKETELEIKDYKIIFRLHPAVSKKIMVKKINLFEIKNVYEIEYTKNSFKFLYDMNSICISGMSGTYYDFLYLGYKTLNFDFNYQVAKKLPRVINSFLNGNQLTQQINFCQKTTFEKWYEMTNPILKETIGMGVLEKRKTTLLEDIESEIFKN